MANAQTTDQPISDDQELAKVLAGVNQEADDATASGSGMTFEPIGTVPAPASDTPVDASANDAAAPADPISETPVVEPLPTPAVTAPVPSAGSSDLDGIKREALNELRPLVDKLDVSPEERFDTYLLLLRSTDDQALIAPAHDAAKNIADEARRAQALLDIIKEIDFLSGQHAA